MSKTSDVIRKELKIEPDDFDKQFLAWVEADTKTQVDHFDEWREAVKKVAELAKNKDYDGVIKAALPIRDLYPDYVEGGSVYEFLADGISRQERQGCGHRRAGALRESGRAQSRFASNCWPSGRMRAGNKKEAAAVLERLNIIYPVDYELHQRLGELWLDEGNAAGRHSRIPGGAGQSTPSTRRRRTTTWPGRTN